MAFGDLLLTRIGTPPGDLLLIDQADDLILVSDLLVEALQRRHCAPWALLDGNVLQLRAVNGDVAYRLGAHWPHRYAREAHRIPASE